MGRLIQLRRHQRDLRDSLRVSARVATLLAGRGVRTVDELLVLSWSDIEAVRGMGWILLQELDEALTERGLRLARAGPPVAARAPTDEERRESIEMLGLHGRTLTALVAGGVGSVGDLVDRTQAELLRLDGVGHTMVREVRHALGLRGLALATYVRSTQPPEPVPGDPETTLDALAEHEYIGTRAYIRLHRAGVATVGAIAAMSAEELLALEGLGRGTLAEIRYALARLGFGLRGEPSVRPRR